MGDRVRDLGWVTGMGFPGAVIGLAPRTAAAVANWDREPGGNGALGWGTGIELPGAVTGSAPRTAAAVGNWDGIGNWDEGLGWHRGLGLDRVP